MTKFDLIKEKYLFLGVKEDNIDFAIDAVIEGAKREVIIDSLTADYRGMKKDRAIQLLEDLFDANGGEFKKENSEGFLYGTFLSILGITCVGFLVGMIISGEWKLKFVVLFVTFALFGLINGPRLLLKSFRGQYRDKDSPFDNP